jgi:hypothetical protein
MLVFVDRNEYKEKTHKSCRRGLYELLGSIVASRMCVSMTVPHILSTFLQDVKGGCLHIHRLGGSNIFTYSYMLGFPNSVFVY